MAEALHAKDPTEALAKNESIGKKYDAGNAKSVSSTATMDKGRPAKAEIQELQWRKYLSIIENSVWIITLESRCEYGICTTLHVLGKTNSTSAN